MRLSSRTSFLPAQIATADLLMLWRLYVIWSYNLWIAVFPATMLAIEMSASASKSLELSNTNRGSVSMPVATLVQCIMTLGGFIINEKAEITGSVCSLLFNVTVTPLIVGRLW